MKILLVDDDPEILDVVSVGLHFHWRDSTVLTAQTGAEGLRVFYEEAPDLVVLDVTIPDSTGFELLQEIRRVSDVPVIMLTALQTETSQVRALDLGADDYVVKPFSVMALLARMRSVLRRAAHLPASGSAVETVIGDLSINFQNQQVWLRGQLVPLTPSEYRLLYELVRNVRRVVPKRVLRERVWSADWEATPNDLKALVSRLRAKLGDNPRRPRFIETHRGLGYRFLGQLEAGSDAPPDEGSDADGPRRTRR
jgi:two-component system KDP operon response regulator KdpE